MSSDRSRQCSREKVPGVAVSAYSTNSSTSSHTSSAPSRRSSSSHSGRNGGSSRNDIGFFPIPWFVWTAYAVYCLFFAGALYYAHCIYICLPEQPAGYATRTDVIAPYVTFIVISFVLKGISVPLARYLMLCRYRASQRGEIHWTLTLRPTRVMFYRDTEFFRWYYNAYPVLHSWAACCFTVLVSMFFYPEFMGAMFNKNVDTPLIPIVIVLVLMVLPALVFLYKARLLVADLLLPQNMYAYTPLEGVNGGVGGVGGAAAGEV